MACCRLTRTTAAVIEGWPGRRWFAQPGGGAYAGFDEPIDILMKVETHNHPTAISPFPGAATGSGGEIRDEGATGRGSKPKAGLVGFTVSNLRIPGATQPWEQDLGKPDRIASALQIMLEGPIGAASFNNEFGRPGICGYFRTFEQRVDAPGRAALRGFHKPIMIAGGLGNIRRQHVEKSTIVAGARIVVLGGPAMLIGLGGGAASSVGAGASSADLDFASVQRGNPEIQRRAQEVIDACWGLGAGNPILLIHDVGAGGLSNAVPESVAHGGCGGRVDLRKVLSDEPGMSPLEIWCNEAQERYVLIVAAEQIAEFGALCDRERCPYAVIGEVTADGVLNVSDPLFGNVPVAMPLDTLLGKPPRMTRDVRRVAGAADEFDGRGIDLRDAAFRLLRLPTVADKTFLVTIGDRSVGGMISRDPLVGPWQVPVSDVAVTVSDYFSTRGEAMAMGERSPLALLDAAASARMAVAEAVTNIAAADIARLEDVRLSANWMAACGEPGEDADLYDAVRAVGEEFCPALGIAIPVGKDSLSMKTAWQHGDEVRKVVAPVSLVVSAFAPVQDVRRTLTPQLRTDLDDTRLVLVDLGAGRDRLGGSCLAQVYGQVGREAPDCDDPRRLRAFFKALARLRRAGLVLAYHDRSDGGLFVTLCEMAFAGHCGIEADLVAVGGESRIVAALFSEELGAVLQVDASNEKEVLEVLRESGLEDCVRTIGRVTASDRLSFAVSGRTVLSATRTELRRAWSETTFRMQSLRDNPACAEEENRRATDPDDPGLHARLTFDPAEDVAAPLILRGARPAIAILREQGVNSQLEMAAAFHRAGFAPVDVHMTDLIAGRVTLDEFRGLVACGGFSYGDVLGAGEGWAKSILFNAQLRRQFETFFARGDSFTLGVCNGCQMLAALKSLVPGTDALAAIRPQSFRAVRGTGGARSRSCRRRRSSLRACRARSCRSRSRTARVARSLQSTPRGESLHGQRARQPAVRRQSWPGDRGVSGQSERVAARHHGTHQRGRARDDPDASSGARVPHRAEFMASGGVGRRQRVDAHVPQRPRLGGLTRDAPSRAVRRSRGHARWRRLQACSGGTSPCSPDRTAARRRCPPASWLPAAAAASGGCIAPLRPSARLPGFGHSGTTFRDWCSSTACTMSAAAGSGAEQLLAALQDFRQRAIVRQQALAIRRCDRGSQHQPCPGLEHRRVGGARGKAHRGQRPRRHGRGTKSVQRSRAGRRSPASPGRGTARSIPSGAAGVGRLRYSGSSCSAISASVMCLRVAPSAYAGHFPPARGAVSITAIRSAV